MKKILISTVLAGSLASVALAQNSGGFIGANLGLPITTPAYGGALAAMKNTFPNTGVGWAIGVDLGYRQAISEKWGLKYYLSYHYNQSYGTKTNIEANISQQLIAANADFYYDFTPSFGAYIGIGLGYQSYKPTYTFTQVNNTKVGGTTKGGFALPLNIGVTYNINDKHQILLGAKIPLVNYSYETAYTSTTGNIKLSTYIVQIGYNFTF